MMQQMATAPAMRAAVPQHVEALMSMSNRMASLEDIIRQQEQVLSAALQRMREMEGVVGTQSRLLEQAHQQIAVLSQERNTNVDNSEKMQSYVQRQNEQINALQAYVQEQMATVQGLDSKYDAVTRGLEQRVMSDVSGFIQRINGLEVANGEAIRALREGLNQQMSSISSTDGRAREEYLRLQREVQSYLDSMRQQEQQLENTMREALRGVHNNLSNEMKDYVTQMQGALREAIEERNMAINTISQRVSEEVANLNLTGSTEVGAVKARIEEVEGSLREGLRTAYEGLASELANLSQYSQGVDNRQKLAHQSIIQELAKHDSQMETIDVNWRASLVDLNAKLDEQVGRLQADQQTAAQTFQHQVSSVQDRFAATVDAINAQLNDLAQRVQDRCVVPIEALRIDTTKLSERFIKLHDDHISIQDYLRKFAVDVEKNAVQLRLVMETAIRAAHGELLERITAVNTILASLSTPEEIRNMITNSLLKLWNDVKEAFSTITDVENVQTQLQNLENAVRQEVLDLANKDTEISRRIDEIGRDGATSPDVCMINSPSVPLGYQPMSPVLTDSVGISPNAHNKTSNDAAFYAKIAEKAAMEARRMASQVKTVHQEIEDLIEQDSASSSSDSSRGHRRSRKRKSSKRKHRRSYSSSSTSSSSSSSSDRHRHRSHHRRRDSDSSDSDRGGRSRRRSSPKRSNDKNSIRDSPNGSQKTHYSSSKTKSPGRGEKGSSQKSGLGSSQLSASPSASKRDDAYGTLDSAKMSFSDKPEPSSFLTPKKKNSPNRSKSGTSASELLSHSNSKMLTNEQTNKNRSSGFPSANRSRRNSASSDDTFGKAPSSNSSFTKLDSKKSSPEEKKQNSFSSSDASSTIASQKKKSSSRRPIDSESTEDTTETETAASESRTTESDGMTYSESGTRTTSNYTGDTSQSYSHESTTEYSSETDLMTEAPKSTTKKNQSSKKSDKKMKNEDFSDESKSTLATSAETTSSEAVKNRDNSTNGSTAETSNRGSESNRFSNSSQSFGTSPVSKSKSEKMSSFSSSNSVPSSAGTASRSDSDASTVPKREYKNFKDFSKEEIDALWEKVNALQEEKGLDYITRAELQDALRKLRSDIMSDIRDRLENQESEILRNLSGIKGQIRDLINDPALLTDVAVFRSPDGPKRIEDVGEHLNTPQRNAPRGRNRNSLEPLEDRRGRNSFANNGSAMRPIAVRSSFSDSSSSELSENSLPPLPNSRNRIPTKGHPYGSIS